MDALVPWCLGAYILYASGNINPITPKMTSCLTTTTTTNGFFSIKYTTTTTIVLFFEISSILNYYFLC